MQFQKSFFNTLLIFFTIIIGSSFCKAQEWQPLGPFFTPNMTFPNDFMLKMANGIGRVSCIRFGTDDSTRLKAIYLGSPYGGLYRSIDRGISWDEIPLGDITPGISDFVKNPHNNNVQYVLTGDPDCILDPNNPGLGSESCQSGGIFRSTDAGKSWEKSPLGNWYDINGKVVKDFWKYPSFKVMRKLIIDPVNPKNMYVVIHTCDYSTRLYDGFVYKSTDAGLNWKVSLYVSGGKLKDIEFNPSNPKIIYAGGNGVYRSTNGGKKWKPLRSSGLIPDSLSFRCEIEVVPRRPGLVYVLACNKKTRQNEIYFSNDRGNTFRFVGKGVLSPDWRTALAVDPNDTSFIYFSCGNKVGCYRSNGKEYILSSTVNSIHDDVHELAIDSSSCIYASTDGGFYASCDTGRTWKGMNYNLNVAECWSVSVAQNGPENVLSGLQDCGTILYHRDSSDDYFWTTVRGGDGMGTAFDPINPLFCYSSDGNNNIFTRSQNGGVFWTRNLGIFNEPYAYLMPFALNPVNSRSILLPYHYVYKSSDRGENFISLPKESLPENKEAVTAIAISPSDTNVIYIAYSNPSWNEFPKEKMYATTDGGNQWEDISAGLNGVNYWNITSIAIDPKDPMHVTVGFKGGGTIKAMTSFEGGKNNSWRDISEGLPPEADINSMIYDSGVTNNLFVATHRGVWQLDPVSFHWTKTGFGLPPVMVSDLDICTDTHVLYAGTHGRGIWKLELK